MRKIIPALALLFWMNPALAAIDEAGAQKLKTSLQKQLDYQKMVNEAFSFESDFEVIYEGEVNVVPKGDIYEATLPRIIIAGKTPEGEESKLDLGVITMNAIPSDKDGEWTVSTALPQELPLGDSGVIAKIGGQTVAGVYNDAYGLIKVNVTLQDITFMDSNTEDGSKSESVKIGTLSYISNLEQNADNSFSGPTKLGIENLSFAGNETEGAFKLGKANIYANADHVTIPSVEEMQTKLKKHGDALKTAKAAGNEISQEDFQKFYDLFFEVYTLKAKGFDFSYNLQDIAASGTPSDEIQLKSFSLANAQFGMNFNDMESDAGKMGLSLGYDGLKLDTVNPDDARIMPENIKLSLAASKVPYNTAGTLLTSSLETIKTNPDMAAMAGMAIMMKLPAIFAQAGTEIKIDHNAKGADYNSTLDGNVIADFSAITSVTGKAKGAFMGLDKLIELVSASQDYADAIEFLSMLQSYGKPISGGYSYEIELKGDGTLLINGEPSMGGDPAMMGGDPAAQ